MSGESDRRRSPGNDDAIVGGMIPPQRLGMTFPIYMNIYSDCYNCSSQHSQRQELTEYTIVCPRCGLSQVAMTTVMHTISACDLCCYRMFFMYVK